MAPIALSVLAAMSAAVAVLVLGPSAHRPTDARRVVMAESAPGAAGASPVLAPPGARPEQAAGAPLSPLTLPGAPAIGAASAIVPGAGASQATPEDEGGFRLTVLYRSQFDGSTFAWGNCGVSAISMAMEFYGHRFDTHDVRVTINEMTGNWDRQIGVDWRYLKTALERRDFVVEGPYAARGGYISWTLDEVLKHVEQGHPTMLMTHYRSLPGHEEDEWIGDHYILVLGVTGDGRIVYHDPGFEGERGAYMTIERERLEHAWATTWIGQNRTAMVILPHQ